MGRTSSITVPSMVGILGVDEKVWCCFVCLSIFCHALEWWSLW